MKTLLIVPVILALPLMAQPRPARDASQPVDEEYTRKIREYTTQPFFNSPLTDYLPASKTVPTPKAVLGDVAGAPGIDRKSTRLNSSHLGISYAVFCLKKKTTLQPVVRQGGVQGRPPQTNIDDTPV